jgi:LysM repeat protein
MAYVVKKGDNLTKIAKQNGLTLKQLLSLNKNIENPDYIKIGQKINLPSQSPTGKSAYDNNDGYPTTPMKKNTPTWDKTTKGAGNPATVANFNKTPEKKAPIKKQVPQKEEPSFFDNLKGNIYEKYQDFLTALDQQTAPKIATKPKVKIDDSFIDYGYKELGTYKDQSFKAGKNDSLLSAVNLFDNDKGFDYVVSPKVKEGIKTFKNVKGVAHFLMDSDITPNQKYTEPYIEKGNKVVKSAVKEKFIPNIGTNPSDYVMYYKNLDGEHVNVKYGQLKDKNKYEGYDQIKVRSVPFSDLDFNKKTNAGFLKKASYIGTHDGKQTSIITDPDSNDVFGRFSGGSGVFYFKEPKTGKTLSMDVSGSVNTIKSVGEGITKKYGVNPKELQFLYHDMGSYSAKPKSHNGVLSNEQWQNYNTNNKGYSGAALMYPMKYGGYAASDNIDMGYYSNPLKYFAAMGINISDDDCLECGGKIKAEDGLNPKPLIPPKPEQIDFEMERQLPPGVSYERDVRKFSWNNRDTAPEQIKLDSSYMLYKTPKGYSNVYNKGKLIGYTVDNKILIPGEPNFQNGGIVRAWIQKMAGGGKPVLEKKSKKLTDANQNLNWVQRGINPENYLYLLDEEGNKMTHKLSYGNDDRGYYVYPNVIQNERGELQDLDPDEAHGWALESGTEMRVPNRRLADYYSKNGLIKHFKKSYGGYAEGGLNIYGDRELTQPTTNYNQFMTMDQLNQKPFENPYQNMNLQQPNTPQFNIPKGQEIEPLASIGVQKMTPDLQGMRNRANQSMQDIAPESKNPMNMNAVNMGLDIGAQSMSAAANLMGSLGKDNSKAQAFGQGATGAMNVASQVTAPFKDIPIAGKAIDAVGKTLGFFIGGALEARRQGIENEEMDKYNKLQEYTSRNTQTAQQPSYYGQYMSKYGSNIKNLEQRLIDDIFSDYDKFMKLT